MKPIREIVNDLSDRERRFLRKQVRDGRREQAAGYVQRALGKGPVIANAIVDHV